MKTILPAKHLSLPDRSSTKSNDPLKRCADCTSFLFFNNDCIHGFTIKRQREIGREVIDEVADKVEKSLEDSDNKEEPEKPENEESSEEETSED